MAHARRLRRTRARHRSRRLRPLSRPRARRMPTSGGTPPTTGSRSSAPRWRSISPRKAGMWPWYRAAIPASSPWRRRSSRRSMAARPAWRRIPITVEPGITAMLAAAARLGAPLGGDFCAMSLSDNLKPWEVIVQRLTAALNADFVISLYNPISSARPWQLGEALKLAGTIRAADTPVMFARAVGRPNESITVTTLDRRRRRPGRHVDAGDDRRQHDEADRAGQRAALRLYAALLRGRAMSGDPRKRLVDRCRPTGTSGRLGPGRPSRPEDRAGAPPRSCRRWPARRNSSTPRSRCGAGASEPPRLPRRRVRAPASAVTCGTGKASSIGSIVRTR